MYKAIILGDVSGIVTHFQTVPYPLYQTSILYSSNGNKSVKPGSELLYLKSHPGYPSRF
jgi:hypothetical protein